MYKNELIYQRWIKEVWNDGNEEAIEELFDEDGVAIYPYFVKGDEPIRGRDDFKKFYKLARKEFSDIKIEISDMTSDGDVITALCAASAKRYDLIDEDTSVITPIEVSGLCRIKFDNGKIVEIWNNIDISDQIKTIPSLKLDNN
jgi:predicted ester cyclase